VVKETAKAQRAQRG